MSLGMGCTVLLCAIAYALLGVYCWNNSFPLASPLLHYAALSYLLLAAAYLGFGVKLLGKTESGRQSLASVIFFGPYFWQSAFILRHSRFEVPYAIVCPNLYFGRRLTSAEAKTALASYGWTGVLDLAAEFAEVNELRSLPGYRSLPILDATAPTLEELREAVAWLRQQVALGPIYVHCALGHGRSASIVVAYLIANDEVNTPENGVTRLRELRPGVRLASSQMKMVKRYQQESATES